MTHPWLDFFKKYWQDSKEKSVENPEFLNSKFTFKPGKDDYDSKVIFHVNNPNSDYNNNKPLEIRHFYELNKLINTIRRCYFKYSFTDDTLILGLDPDRNFVDKMKQLASLSFVYIHGKVWDAVQQHEDSLGYDDKWRKEARSKRLTGFKVFAKYEKTINDLVAKRNVAKSKQKKEIQKKISALITANPEMSMFSCESYGVYAFKSFKDVYAVEYDNNGNYIEEQLDKFYKFRMALHYLNIIVVPTSCHEQYGDWGKNLEYRKLFLSIHEECMEKRRKDGYED